MDYCINVWPTFTLIIPTKKKIKNKNGCFEI